MKPITTFCLLTALLLGGATHLSATCPSFSTEFSPLDENSARQNSSADLLDVFSAGTVEKPIVVYTFPIDGDIMPAQQRLVTKCLSDAISNEADLVLIRLNTYGGLVHVADSIRTMILNSPIPIWAFIDNQAVSAGALIAIAAERIYMHPGSSIGAASVVDQNGKPMPDKFQSFMRATMRSTAEAHGKVIVRIDGNDTLWRWRRDPKIAEAMVGKTVGDSTTSEVLAFTASEALEHHYSEGTAPSIDEVLSQGGIQHYKLLEYTSSRLDRLLDWLMNPVVQGIFVMMIVGGIYFELQTPGIGFALAVAILGAVLYFAPLYIEGIAQYWELILFVIGLILLAVEIFVLPGFGIAGVAGIVALIISLSFAAIDHDLLRHLSAGEVTVSWLLRPVLVVIIASSVALLGGIALGRRFLSSQSPLQKKVVLTAEMKPEDGYVSHPIVEPKLVGRTALVVAVLHPSGRVMLDGQYYDAVGEDGLFIKRGEMVTITRVEGGTLYCIPQESKMD